MDNQTLGNACIGRLQAWTVESPLGRLTLTEENGALTRVFMEGQKYFPEHPEADWVRTDLLAQAEEWLNRYFAGQAPGAPAFPMRPGGTAFRRQVWELLMRIPYGQTTTYASVAAEIARMRGMEKMSARAVGSAVGHNPISILIPCHRVLGSGGALTGYAGGLERKRWLLEWEKETQ